MAGRGSDRRDWDHKGQVRRLSEDKAARAAALRQKASRLLQSRLAAPAPSAAVQATPTGYGSGISRPLPTAVRYLRTTADDDSRLVLGSGRPLAEALFQTMADRRDHTILVWPKRPENAFVTAAILVQEGRAMGRLGRATVAVWPWRPALTWAARTVLVDATDMASMAKATLTDLEAGKAILAKPEAGRAWTKAAVALDPYALLTVALRDLHARRGSRFTVRHPSLLDVTPVYEPRERAASPYEPDPAQFLHRVKDHTRIAEMNGCEADHFRRLGDPAQTPFAVFGLPVGEKALARCMAFPRFASLGLDLVIVDVTRPARDHLGPDWDRRLAAALDAINRMGEARPGIAVITDDVFAARKAEAALRDRAATARLNGRYAGRTGVLLRADFLRLEAAAAPPEGDLPAVRYQASLKDGSLLGIRKTMLSLASRLDSASEGGAARAVKAALAFLRRVCALPVGYAEAKCLVMANHGSDDDLDRRVRARLFVDGALAPLDEAIRATPGFRAELQGVYRLVAERLKLWDRHTPFSLKLVDLRARAAEGDLLVLPNADSLGLFLSSEAGAEGRWRAVDAGRVAEALAAQPAGRMILVQPGIEALRDVLLMEGSPPEVALMIDAASAALFQAELRPLTEIAAFSTVRARATALSREIGKAEADLAGDAEDPAFDLPAHSLTLDFTQSAEGGAPYTGPIVQISTARDYVIRHRPGSLVIRYTPSDIRAFERVEAWRIEGGDAILVMTRRLLEAFRRELARAPKTLDTLRAYHSDFPSDEVPDAEKERILREARRGGDWTSYVGMRAALATPNLPAVARDGMRLAMDNIEASWEKLLSEATNPGSKALTAVIRERQDFVRRYDPVRMAVEHKTFAAEKLENPKRKGDGRKLMCVDLLEPDAHLVPDGVGEAERPEMVAAVRDRMDMLGIHELSLVRDLEICEYAFGYSRTSPLPTVDRDKSGGPIEMPVTLRLFQRAGDPPKHPILCINQENEAFYVRLREETVLEWLARNGMPVDLGEPPLRLGARLIEGYPPFSRFLDEYRADPPVGPRVPYSYVYTLLHTMAHQLIGIVSELSGLDLGSFGEHMFVPDLAFLVYRRGTTMDLGNLSSMWRNYGDVSYGNLVLERMVNPESLRCGSETVCEMRGGACPDCVLIPETSCLTRNELLSRSVLVGRGRPKWDEQQADVREGYYGTAQRLRRAARATTGAMAAE